jgi:hypothetical protein
MDKKPDRTYVHFLSSSLMSELVDSRREHSAAHSRIEGKIWLLAVIECGQ